MKLIERKYQTDLVIISCFIVKNNLIIDNDLLREKFYNVFGKLVYAFNYGEVKILK